jgi:hypothetical protein
MFIGHFAVALAAKRATPVVSLGWLFLACQLADLVWPTLVLLGVERLTIDPGNTAFTPLNFAYYPYSHSLVALAVWSALVAFLYAALNRTTIVAAAVVGVTVISHWVLDVVSHRPDMPLTISGSTHLGFGLWQSVAATVIVEAVMFLVGLVLYLRTTRSLDRIGSVGFWSLMAFLGLIGIGNIFSPPPPSAEAVAWSVEGLWLVVAWAFWVDRHRTSLRPSATSA